MNTLRLSMLLVVAAAIAWPMWPRPFGGRANYTVVSGISMEPTYHTGDLVITRSAPTYDVGDIVVYRTEDGDVVHRVVGGNAEDGYVIRGDNKDHDDPWRPTPENIRGKAWLHVPKLGGMVVGLRNRVPLPVVGGLLAMVLTADSTRRLRRRRRRTSRNDRPRPTVVDLPTPRRRRMSKHPKISHSLTRGVATGGLALTAVALLVLAPTAWAAFRTAPKASDSGSGLTHELSFEYTAIAKGTSVVYPTGKVGPVQAPASAEAPPANPNDSKAAPSVFDDNTSDTASDAVPPQTLYRDLIDRLDVIVRYAHHGVDATVNGTYQVDLEVTAPDGWSTTIPEVPATDFDEEAIVQVPVTFDRAQARINEVAALTGSSPSDFQVQIVPTFRIRGDVEGHPITTTVSDPLTLQVSATTIQPTGSLRYPHSEPAAANLAAPPASVTLLGMDVTVPEARRFSVFGLLGLLAVAAGLTYLGWARRPADRVRLLNRARLVDVAPGASDVGRPVAVTSFNELRRLATRDDRTILHQELGPDHHRYFVPDGDLTYEFVLGASLPDESLRGHDRNDAEESSPETRTRLWAAGGATEGTAHDRIP